MDCLGAVGKTARHISQDAYNYRMSKEDLAFRGFWRHS